MSRHTGRSEAFPRLSALLQEHEISVNEASRQAGIHFTSFHKILRGHQQPTLSTLSAILDFARRYEPGVTFEDLFADPGADQASDAPERAVASAAGGAHTPCETQILSGASRGDHE